MRLKFLAPVVICFFCHLHAGICQEFTIPHTGVRPVNTLLNPAVRLTLQEMFNALSGAVSNSQRADICYEISRYYADYLKVDSALFFSDKVKEESETGKYEKGIAKYYLSRSFALYLRWKGDIPELKKALEIFLRYKDDWFIGYTSRQLARQYERLSEYDVSRSLYRSAIAFLSKTGDQKELQWLYYELGKSFYKSYEADSSTYYFITALELAEKINHQPRTFLASQQLAEMYMESGNTVKALEYAKKAYDIRVGINRTQIRTLLSIYARCLLNAGDFDKADIVMREYEALNEKLGDAWGNVTLSRIRGIYQYHKGNYAEALTHFQATYNKKGEIADFGYDLKDIYAYLAKTEYKLGMYDQAIHHFTELNQLVTEMNFGADLYESLLMISQSYYKKGNTDSAYRYFRLYDHLKDSIMTFRKEKAIIEVATKYETEKKEQQIQLLQRESEVNALQLKSKTIEIEKQSLIDAQKSQQLSLLSQQNEISRLTASEKTLALENQQKEMVKKQNELTLLAKENELQATVAAKEGQRKNFAYIAIAGILFFSGYVFYRYTRNKQLSRQLAASLVELKQAQEQLIKTEKEKEAENIRVRISRDIHDEVGATLSGVALFSEIARERMKQHRQEDAQVYLDHITVNSKEMVDKMSDIVWAINPDNDSFERIVAKLQSYAFNLCAGKGIALHIRIDDAIREYYPSMQVKRNLYLFMKEAINNAVKYSEGANISLSLQKEGDCIIAEIKDDGKGFDSSIQHEGNGLNNMRARATSLQARFSIDSQTGKGTNVMLQFDFHPAGGQIVEV